MRFHLLPSTRTQLTPPLPLSFPLKTYANLASVINVQRAAGVLGAAGDVALSAALVYLVARGRTATKRNYDLWDRILLWTVNTGVLAAICAVCAMVSVSLLLPKKFGRWYRCLCGLADLRASAYVHLYYVLRDDQPSYVPFPFRFFSC